MKKSVYEYICTHSGTDIHAVAKALNLDEMQILKVINELLKESYIKMETPSRLVQVIKTVAFTRQQGRPLLTTKFGFVGMNIWELN